MFIISDRNDKWSYVTRYFFNFLLTLIKPMGWVIGVVYRELSVGLLLLLLHFLFLCFFTYISIYICIYTYNKYSEIWGRIFFWCLISNGTGVAISWGLFYFNEHVHLLLLTFHRLNENEHTYTNRNKVTFVLYS